MNIGIRFHGLENMEHAWRGGITSLSGREARSPSSSKLVILLLIKKVALPAIFQFGDGKKDKVGGTKVGIGV